MFGANQKRPSTSTPMQGLVVGVAHVDEITTQNPLPCRAVSYVRSYCTRPVEQLDLAWLLCEFVEALEYSPVLERRVGDDAHESAEGFSLNIFRHRSDFRPLRLVILTCPRRLRFDGEKGLLELLQKS